MHIFVDLDGVLGDFCQAAVDLHKPGQSDAMVMARGRAIDPKAHPFKQLELGLGVSASEFWGGIQAAGPGFWSGMKMLPHAMQLWKALTDIVPPDQLSILSSPGMGYNAGPAAAGKYAWVCEHLGEDWAYRTIICPAPLKTHLNGSHQNILIDDYDKNCDSWGGLAIQCPSLQFDDMQPTQSHIKAIIDAVKLAGGLIEDPDQLVESYRGRSLTPGLVRPLLIGYRAAKIAAKQDASYAEQVFTECASTNPLMEDPV